MIEIKSGYLLELESKEENKRTIYAIVIPTQNGLSIFSIDKTDECKYKNILNDWLQEDTNFHNITFYKIKKVYGLSKNGRLSDITTRELLWNEEDY
jgi:hypothetical protein